LAESARSTRRLPAVDAKPWVGGTAAMDRADAIALGSLCRFLHRQSGCVATMACDLGSPNSAKILRVRLWRSTRTTPSRPLMIVGFASPPPREPFPPATDMAYSLRGYPSAKFRGTLSNEHRTGSRSSLGHRAVDRRSRACGPTGDRCLQHSWRRDCRGLQDHL